MNRVAKYLLLLGMFAIGTARNSLADEVITLEWGALDATSFNDTMGTTLPVGDLVEVGTFSTTNGITQFATAAANLANFTAFATCYVGDGAAQQDGFAAVSNNGPDKIGRA